MVHGVENGDAVFATSATEPIGPMTEARATLPRFDPFAPYLSPGSRDEACAKLRIACLQMEA